MVTKITHSGEVYPSIISYQII